MDKIKINELLKSGKEVFVEIGCGENKMKGAIGLDIVPLEGVDIVMDFEKGLGEFPDNSVDRFYSRHVLEHIENFELLLRDIHRALKPQGYKDIIVPHFSNPFYYSDFTHKRFFGLYTFDYFSPFEFQLKRKVPSFYVDFKFKVLKRKLVFRSTYKLSNLIRKFIVTPLVNHNSYTQELYERRLTNLISCQEIEFRIQPIK